MISNVPRMSARRFSCSPSLRFCDVYECELENCLMMWCWNWIALSMVSAAWPKCNIMRFDERVQELQEFCWEKPERFLPHQQQIGYSNNIECIFIFELRANALNFLIFSIIFVCFHSRIGEFLSCSIVLTLRLLCAQATNSECHTQSTQTKTYTSSNLSGLPNVEWRGGPQSQCHMNCIANTWNAP